MATGVEIKILNVSLGISADEVNNNIENILKLKQNLKENVFVKDCLYQ